MLKDIANNQFIEYGQFDGSYYGTKFETIRQCIRSSRMCILDISPQVGCRLRGRLHVLHVFCERGCDLSCSLKRQNSQKTVCKLGYLFYLTAIISRCTEMVNDMPSIINQYRLLVWVADCYFHCVYVLFRRTRLL